jgi:hypothetical protein
MFLEIVTSPPDLFYNDPKSNSFEVVLGLRTSADAAATDAAQLAWQRVIVEIVYERGESVDNQDILEFIDTPGRIKRDESAAFRFRINQVSRNHLNRRFRLRFRLEGQPSVQVESTPVMVLSKEASKRSRGKKNKSGGSTPTTNKRARKSGGGKNDQWIAQACELFKGIAWQRAGYEVVQDAAGEEHIDKHAPIFRCVCCGAMTGQLGVSGDHAHQPTCALNSLLSAQNHRAEPPQAATPVQHLSAPSASPQLCLDGNLASDANADIMSTTTSNSSMAQDLQDILNIPASSFKWLEEELADEDDLLSQYSDQTPSRVPLDLIRQQDPSLIR